MGGIRQGLKYAAVAVIAAALAAVGATAAAAQDDKAKHEAAKKEGKLLVYSGRTVEQIQQIIQAFEAKYPGIKVDHFRADLSQVIQRYETEAGAGRPSADVLDLVERRSQALAQKGLSTPYTSPHLKDYAKDLIAPDGQWTNYAMNLVSFAWNTNKVKPGEEPKTLDDLLDPKWAGRMGFQDPVQGGGSQIWIITLAGVWGEAKWADYMKRLGQQKPKYGAYMQVQNMLTAGEVDVMIAAYPNFLQPTIDKGAPAKWAKVDPMVRTFFSLTLAKKPESPKAAELFIDYLLSKDGQDMLAKINQLPIREETWPAAYKSLAGAKYVAQDWPLEDSKPDFWRERVREYFGQR
jgi:iron(III) transport system substrate-binding protein